MLSEALFVVYQFSWAIEFASSGLWWPALTTSGLAACVLVLGYYYGDHAGKMFVVIDKDLFSSRAGGVQA